MLRLLCKNYKLHNSEFVEKTIKEIANISNLVSPTGNKWIYNIATEKGMLFHSKRTIFYIAERFSFNESPSAFSISGGDFIE